MVLLFQIQINGSTHSKYFNSSQEPCSLDFCVKMSYWLATLDDRDDVINSKGCRL